MINDGTCQEDKYLRNEKLELNGALFLVTPNGNLTLHLSNKLSTLSIKRDVELVLHYCAMNMNDGSE